MHPTSWTETHERLLADAEPPVPEPPDAEVHRVWLQVAAAIESDGEPRSRRRVRVGVAACISAVLLGTSGLAVAQLYTARTGEGPVDAEDLRLGGLGEKLALAAPDYGEAIAEETEDIPFPNAEARELALQQQVDDVRGGAG